MEKNQFQINIENKFGEIICGAWVEEGWHRLVYELCTEILDCDPPEDFSIEQIKEKFGQLRFYVTNSTSEIDELILAAELIAQTICEYCGSRDDVKISSRGESHWAKNLCANCKSLD